MKEGSIKFWNDAKGYGFIKDNESGKEFFTHATFLVDRKNIPVPGDFVEFETREGKSGKEEAFNVEKI